MQVKSLKLKDKCIFKLGLGRISGRILKLSGRISGNLIFSIFNNKNPFKQTDKSLISTFLDLKKIKLESIFFFIILAPTN